jgi:hypothetical protein
MGEDVMADWVTWMDRVTPLGLVNSELLMDGMDG